MPLVYTSLQVGQSIIASSLCDEGLCVIDTIPTVYSYTLSGVFEKHTVLKGFKTYLHRYGRGATISPCGKHALLCENDCNKVMLFDLQNRKIAEVFEAPKGPEFAIFGNEGRYFAYANSVGRFVIYEMQDYSAMYHQLQFEDAISTAVFSDDNTKIAIATLTKKVKIFDMQTKEIEHIFLMEDYVEGLTISKDNKSVVAYTRGGHCHIMNLILGETFIADPCSEWPTVLAHAKDTTISLLGTRSNQLHVYASATGNKIATITLEHWGVTSLSLHQKKVFIGFSDGNGILIDNTRPIEDALQALEAKNYEKLCLITYEFPLILTYLELAKSMEKCYLEILNHKAAGHNEKIGHESLVTFLLSANISRQELLRELYKLPEIAEFMSSYSEGKKDQACNIAYNAPLLRQLREFSQIKTNCYRELAHELHLLESSEELFQEYIEKMPSNCSTCIYSVIPEPNALGESYKQLVTTANANNFSAVMQIVDKFPVLRQTKVFQRIISYGEAFIDKTLSMIRAGKMDMANQFATTLTRIQPFAITGMQFKAQIQEYEKFEQACKKNDVVAIFALTEANPILRTTNVFKEQLQHYQDKVLNAAIAYASQGQVKKMKEALGAYYPLEYFAQKHFNLYKFALLREFVKYAPHGKEQEILDRYHSYFGWDKHYEGACILYDCKIKEDVKLSEVLEEHKQLESLIDPAEQKVQRMDKVENIDKKNGDEK